jgi:serine/threonine protein kinase
MDPRSGITHPIVELEMVVAFPDYGDSIDNDRPLKEFPGAVPKITARRLWDIDEFLALRNFLLRCLGTFQKLGVAHRDIKPANILKRRGVVRRSDFKLIDLDSSRLALASPGTKHVTFTGLWSRPGLTADVARTAPVKFWIENDQYSCGLTLLAIGCQLTPEEIQAAKTDLARRTEYLKALSEKYKPESRQIVEDLMKGAFASAGSASGDVRVDVHAPLDE